MKKIVLYFGDVFWCTNPYVGVSLYYELSKNFEVIPLFGRGDIRLRKEWRANEKFWFDKNVFLDLPYIESDDIAKDVAQINPDLFLLSAQMQSKGPFSARNRQIKSLGIKIGMWDVGGGDAMWCDKDSTGWEYFFSKGKLWKENMVNTEKIKSKTSVVKMSNQPQENIFITGTLDFDNLSNEKNPFFDNFHQGKKEFCKKYGLDPTKPIIAYIPANPAPDKSFMYPSGLSAREALSDINNTLMKIKDLGAQICLKSHPNDYISSESQNEYFGIHPRSQRGGYKQERYRDPEYKEFTLIEAQDGFNLYNVCDLGVTNYSHSGYELFICKKKCYSYRMKEVVEWHFVDDICENVYTDVENGNELEHLISKDLQVINLEGRKKIEQNTAGKDIFFKNISNVPAYKLIASKIEDILENDNQ